MINTTSQQRQALCENLRFELPKFEPFLIVIVGLFLNSILRGLRAPGRWVSTTLLFNYDFGFSRRGLLGAAIASIHNSYLYSYNFSFWFSFVIFAVEVFFLGSLLIQLGAIRTYQSRLGALVFSSSLGVVWLTHSVGYFDHIGLLATLLILRAQKFWIRASLAAVLFPLCLLIHEVNFVLFFPVLCLIVFLDCSCGANRSRWFFLGGLVIMITCILLILTTTSITEREALGMYHTLQAKSDYLLRKDAFLSIASTSEHFSLVSDLWRDEGFQHYVISSAIVTLPTAIYFFRASVRLLRSAGQGPMVFGMAGAASFSPLSLLFVGGDSTRWCALAGVTSFVVLAVVTVKFRGVATHKASQNAFLIGVVLVALNLGSSIPLFDGYVVQSFPYEQHIDYVRRLILGKESFPPKPEGCLLEGSCGTIIASLCAKSAVELSRWSTATLPELDCADAPYDHTKSAWYLRLMKFIESR